MKGEAKFKRLETSIRDKGRAVADAKADYKRALIEKFQTVRRKKKKGKV